MKMGSTYAAVTMEDPTTEREVGLVMLGTVVFSALTGLGVGAFVNEPAVGGIAGTVVGIVAGVLAAPGLVARR